MVDNRCANPAYALDVDEMTLEYLLYNATKARLTHFKSRREPGDDSLNASANSATTLLQVFDQFLELFKCNHPDYDFSLGLEFNIKLLQFLVLFTHRKSPQALSQSSRDQLKQSSQQTSFLRMKWWDMYRAAWGHNAAEYSIIESWRGFFASPAGTANEKTTTHHHAEATNFVPLLDLLPHFLDLSANMAANLGQDVTKQWMALAAEFMLQSAWEKHVYLDAESNEEPLKIAFGWGRWDRRELENTLMSAEASVEVKAAEMRVNTIFITCDEEAAGLEIPAWSKVRLEYLSAFGTPPAGIDSVKHAQRWQVKQLREIAERFPVQVFDGKIMEYLEGLWKLGRKPLLVEIEEGKIAGLTGEEFENFMKNVFPKGSVSQEDEQGGRWWN